MNLSLHPGLWLAGIRPKTLPASIAPVVVGAAAAWNLLGTPNGWGPRCVATDQNVWIDMELGKGPCGAPWYAIDGAMPRFALTTLLCAGVALFLQIAVNFANDYSDGVRGVDEGRDMAETGKTGNPGGPGRSGEAAASRRIPKPRRLVASGVPPKRVLAAAGIAAALACLCGLGVVLVSHQYWLIGVGVLCLIAGWCYTGGRHPYGYAGLGEMSVFVFFGLVATLGTEFAVTQSLDGLSDPGALAIDFSGPFTDGWNGWNWFWAGEFGVDLIGLIAAVACGLNAVALLMVNNLRDIDGDRAHGKRTLAVRLGATGARIAFIVVVVVEELLAGLLVTVLWAPWGMLLLVSSLAVPVRMIRGTTRDDFRGALMDAGYQTIFFAMLFAICAAVHAA